MNIVNGVLVARLVVDKEGLPVEIRPLSFLPDGLTEEAIDAIKQMKFAPALKGGEPVAFAITLEVEFQIR